MMKHTPGPWIIESSHEIIWIGTGKNNNTKVDEIILHINQDEQFKEAVKEKNLANAKLIAAAPELLEALQMFMNASTLSKEGKVTINTQRHIDAMQFGEAAIKKATE